MSADDCCESPQRTFQVRNDGQPPLANDTPAKVALPMGTISEVGLAAIRRYLRTRYDATAQVTYNSLSYDVVAELPVPQWQTAQGNYTKRLSKHAYTTYRFNLNPDDLSEIGNIARDHSGGGEIAVEVTRELNRNSTYFLNAGSCWWGAERNSRCALKTNGGFALRSFDSGGHLAGRAWVLPMRRVTRLDDSSRYELVPTFDAMTPDAFVTFNGYGDLNNYTAPRVLAQMAGWTYKKIRFYCAPMYINSGGYLVAPQDLVNDASQLELEVPRHSDLFATEQTAGATLS